MNTKTETKAGLTPLTYKRATPEQRLWLARYRSATGLDPSELQEWLRGEATFAQMKASAVNAIRLMLAEIQ